VKAFVAYTAARLGLFAVAFGLIWLIFGRWLTWNQLSVLWTALLALVLSSVVALIWLRRLRDRFAAQVAARADRAKAAYEARVSAEDDD
jgi:ABC-type bacteriocin/lantibiotic exporter with double-glycine peptidase domain